MDDLTQVEVLTHLNNKCVQPTEDLEAVLEILNIKFIDDSEGWEIINKE